MATALSLKLSTLDPQLSTIFVSFVLFVANAF